jgi:hypothetical protein
MHAGIIHAGKLLASRRRKVPLTRRAYRYPGQRFSRVASRCGRCGGRFFLRLDAFLCHGLLHPRHGSQASPRLLARCLSLVALSLHVAFPSPRGSSSCFPVFSLLVCVQCSAFIYYRLLDIVTLESPFPYFAVLVHAHGLKCITQKHRGHDREK